MPRDSALSPLPVARRVAMWPQWLQSLAHPDWPEHAVVGGTQPAAGRTAGGGVRDQNAASTAELGEVHGEVRMGSGSVVAWAAGSSSRARWGMTGAEEPHTVGGELHASSIELGVDLPRHTRPSLPSRSAMRKCLRWPRLPSRRRRPIFG